MNKAIILAAGEGTRMKSTIPKVLHSVCGKSIIKYVIDASKAAGIDENILVLGHGKEKIEASLHGESVTFTYQPIGENQPYGTGFAVMQAISYIKDEDTVLILNGDVPLIKSDTLASFIREHHHQEAKATILTADFDNPKGYGRIVRNHSGRVESIIEEKDANEDQKRIKEINSGIYCFSGKYLKEVLNLLDTNNAQNEYYITDAIGILSEKGLAVCAYKIQNPIEIAGVNNRYQLHELNMYQKHIINQKHMLNGVTIIDSQQTYIEDTVEISNDVVIYPGTHIRGDTTIESGCVIGPQTLIEDSRIGPNNCIEMSKVIKSETKNNCKIGPFAYLRPGSQLGNNVKIGDFVEVKNTIIGDGSKASHLAYLGDGIVGENVNVGCGVIFVNYDGINKHKTIIEDNAFIGSNTNLVAPVTVARGGYVACGSTITENVNENEMAIARARQVNIGDKGKNKYK